VGLDPQLREIPGSVSTSSPADTIVAFNRAIVDATADVVAAYKPNLAFYEEFGADGLRALERTVEVIRDHGDAVVILDAKRADIGSTNEGYARSLFDHFGADAITINPYFGQEAVQPFLDYAGKIVFVLCRTSNKGASEFQDLDVGGTPLYMHVARQVAEHWARSSATLGLVVGATKPAELQQIRAVDQRLPLLIPGVGAQGGEPAAVIRSVLAGGTPSVLVNSSRQILYADKDKTADFAAKSRQAAVALADTLREGWAAHAKEL